MSSNASARDVLVIITDVARADMAVINERAYILSDFAQSALSICMIINL